jgi:cell division protein FtsI (penicillin-binding protein 3)
MGFTPVTNPRLVVVVTINRTAGDAGMGASAAGPVFNKIATEALRMLDVPKDIPESIAAAPKTSKADFPAEADVAIADIGGTSVMEEDTSMKMLLAEQVKPVPDPDEIPAAPGPQALIASGPTVPDFRGKSMRDVVEQASADGIHVTLEGSGVARAQLPPPGSPLRRGERIRIVFAR